MFTNSVCFIAVLGYSISYNGSREYQWAQQGGEIKERKGDGFTTGWLEYSEGRGWYLSVSEWYPQILS